ncbi:helix-turn-helix domain-containing protein [Ectopseudomonas khazarica]|uniref:helix-turn-helix domain-containing protein n=1 Tax=Ectopseudomonas khazarica TaxID=2502979 RepID=UPI0038516966
MTATIRKQSASWQSMKSCAISNFAITKSNVHIKAKMTATKGNAKEIITTKIVSGELLTDWAQQLLAELNVRAVEVENKASSSYIDADDFERQLISEDAAFAKNLLRARQKLGKVLGAQGLKAIRLNAGLSQLQLAELIGTSQPHIARLEKAPQNMQLDTAVKLSHALSIDLKDIAIASGLIPEPAK